MRTRRFVSDFQNKIIDEATFRQDLHRKDPEEAYLVPFLNIETLCQDPMRLLALMHYRAHADPTHWISFDREMIQVYFNAGLISTAYNPQCVQMYAGQFGALVPWQKGQAHRWKVIGYPLAHSLLRRQSMISNFLRKVTAELLNHIGEQLSNGSEIWTKLVATSFQTQSIRSAYYNRPFATPPQFDIGHIVKALKLRSDASRDEALMLQADPIYLRHHLRSAEKSKTYSLYDDDEKRKMLFIVSVNGMVQCNRWNFLLAMARWVEYYFLNNRQALQQGSTLSEEYEQSLQVFEASLRACFQDLVVELIGHVGNNPAFRKHFRGGLQVTRAEDNYISDPLFWALTELASQNKDVNKTACWLFGFIEEHLYDAAEEEKSRMDQATCDHLSHIALVDEIIMAIESHRSYSPLLRKSVESTVIYNDYHSRSFSKMMLHLLGCCYGDPDVQTAFDRFRQFPGKRGIPNKSKLAQNDSMYESFTTYWEVLRKRLHAHLQATTQIRDVQAEKFLDEKLGEYSKGHPHLFRAEQDALRAAIHREEEAEDEAREARYSALTSQRHDHCTGRNIVKNQSNKNKVKTRALQSSMPAPRHQPESLKTTATSPKPTIDDTISVNAKAVKLFKHMFSSQIASERETDWKDLAAAMVEAGCSATHGGGSAVTFQDERNNKGAIVVHKPHDSIVPHVFLKGIGRRLTDWFGWDENTFVERERGRP